MVWSTGQSRVVHHIVTHRHWPSRDAGEHQAVWIGNGARLVEHGEPGIAQRHSVSDRDLHPQGSRSPLGSGIGLPNSRAVSIQSRMASFTFLKASSWLSPWTMQPGSSGTFAMKTASTLLQYRMISYLYIAGYLPGGRFGASRPSRPDVRPCLDIAGSFGRTVADVVIRTVFAPRR